MSDNKRCLLAVAFSDRFRDEGHYEPVYIHPTRGRRDGPSTNILTLIKAVTVADFPVFCTVSCLLDFSRASRDRAACCQLPPSPLASSLLFPASLSFLLGHQQDTDIEELVTHRKGYTYPWPLE